MGATQQNERLKTPDNACGKEHLLLSIQLLIVDVRVVV
jgi:hypothetical protein